MASAHLAVDRDPPRFTRTEVEALAEAGAFGDQMVELLDGTVIAKADAVTPAHSQATHALGQYLRSALAATGLNHEVLTESPLVLSSQDEPRPDVIVIDQQSGPVLLRQHPTTAHLVIEIAVSTRAMDLGRKAALYARAGIPRYLVIDINARITHDHTYQGAMAYPSPALVPWANPITVHTPPGTISITIDDAFK